MFKKIICTIISSIFLFGFFILPVLAQEEELINPGLLPDSPFYFFKTLSEDIKTFFTFDNTDKAERYAELAQLRIAEMKALVEKDKKDKVEKVLERYQNQLNKSLENIEKVKEKNEEKNRERLNQITEKIALDTAKYYAFLNDDFGQVQSEIKNEIRNAKEVTSNGQIKALKIILEEKTDKVVEMYQEALQVRLNSIDTGVDYDDLESADDAVKEYKKYTNFGQEISELAKGIRVGETTVEELVEKATSNSTRVLEQVKVRVNEQAKDKIQDAVNTTEQVRERVENQIRARVNESDEGEKNREENKNQNENQTKAEVKEGVCLTEDCDNNPTQTQTQTQTKR